MIPEYVALLRFVASLQEGAQHRQIDHPHQGAVDTRMKWKLVAQARQPEQVRMFGEHLVEYRRAAAADTDDEDGRSHLQDGCPCMSMAARSGNRGTGIVGEYYR